MSRLVAILVIALFAASIRSEPASDQQIRDWIRNLDDSSYRKRDQAAKHLQQAGPAAVAELAKAAKKGSAEVSDRAMRILGSLADGSNAKAVAAARRQLRRLADGDSHVAETARKLLNRKRYAAITQLTFASASYRENKDGMVYVDLDHVTDLATVLPALQAFPELEQLAIGNKRFTDALAAKLPEMPNLRAFNLYQSNIGDEGLEQLTRFKNLRELPIGETRITDKGLKTIGRMTQLEYLGLRGDKITDGGLSHLKDLKNLTGLYLGETKVTDQGLRQLVPLTKLQWLILEDTAISDAGLEHLKGFKDLRRLNLTRTKTTPEGRKRLKEALPDLEIYDTSKR